MNSIQPVWPAAPRVGALSTTRLGGVGKPPYADFNLGDHVGDDPEAVTANRARLRALLPSEPVWLKQVHGTRVVLADNEGGIPEADASVAFEPGTVCAVLTADCLPVLFSDGKASRVAAAHAGWRGLAGGVLEATVQALQCTPNGLMAWLGPAIGPQAFEVGEDVRDVFVHDLPDTHVAFLPHGPGKWLADIYTLARLRLARAGVRQVYGGGYCTMTDASHFFSYRRDRTTGRMATLIWLRP